MGISTVAVFSEADRDALHVSLADESSASARRRVAESYLNMAAIISAAVCSPGRRPSTRATACSRKTRALPHCARSATSPSSAPSARSIRQDGRQGRGPATMRAAGVPVIPGCDAVEQRGGGQGNEAETDRLPAADQGPRRRRRPRHPPGQRRRGAGKRLPLRSREAQAPLATARVYMEKIPVSGQAHRDADALRQARQRRLPGRARMLHAAQEPEAD